MNADLRMIRFRALVLAAAVAVAAPARAQEPPAPVAAAPPAEEEATRLGREAFQRGLELAAQEHWGEALESFETAASHRDAPLVEFNIAYCLRALGHYVAARQAIDKALAGEAELPPPQREDAHAYAAEFEGIVVRVEATLDPPSARLTVDGRPLVAAADGTELAGVAPAGDGEAPGKGKLTIVLDPGSHVFRAVRPGHADAVVRKSYRAGQRATLDLRLDELPATVRLKSRPDGAVVTVGGRDVGVTPMELERRAGRYDLVVQADDYDPYTATLDLGPGESADLTAELVPATTPLYERWWFWTSVAAAAATVAVVTWAVTRPEPETPPYDGGSTGWVATPSLVEF
jgi:PEGA domain-containing protein